MFNQYLNDVTSENFKLYDCLSKLASNKTKKLKRELTKGDKKDEKKQHCNK